MTRKRRRKQKHRPTQPPDRDSNPTIPWLHGLAAMGDERWEEAITSFQVFQEVTGDDQSRPEDRRMVYQNLSACYLDLERYDESLAALNEVQRYTPDNPDIFYNRGIILACAGRIPEASASFKTLSRRWPRQARQLKVRKTLRQLRQIQSGEASPGDYLVDHLQEQVSHNVELEDFHLVERKGKRMIAANPRRSEGHFALGVACVESKRYQEALEAFLNAHDCSPKHAITLYNLGYTFLQMGEPEQAIPWLERALRRDSKYLSALFQLGVAYEQLDRRDEALDLWQQALKIDPDHYPVRERLHEIGQGPEPVEPPMLPQTRQAREIIPSVKAQMRRPRVYRNGGLTLTSDGKLGYTLEDSENRRNITAYTGGPFQVARFQQDEDILDLMGLVKMLLRMINAENTRDVAVLTYYTDRPVFSYQVQFARGKQTEFDAGGQFVVTEVPRFFKLRMDSDLSTPYGEPMQGILIYLNQHPKPGVLVSTMGLDPSYRKG